MKKTLLGITLFFAHIFSIQAQTLYGTTSGGGNDEVGTINKLMPATNNLTIPKSFESMATHPFYTNFIQASDGKLYSMTAYGGNSDDGAIISFDPSSSTYTKLKNFEGGDGANPHGSLMQASNGKLYGMTYAGGSSDDGVIFSFDPSSSTYTKLMDFDGTNGANPSGSLVQASDGKLYGLTPYVIFSFDPSSSTYAKLKDLDNFNVDDD